MDGDDLRAVGRRDRRRHRSQEGSGPRGRERVAVRRGHRQRTEDLVAGRGPAPGDLGRAWTRPRTGPPSEIVGWVAEHATTRVGPRGRQVQVPVERIEAAVIRHYTSRAGDPHRHLHLQVNARVWAAGAWRGLHSVGVRDIDRGDQRDRARRGRHRPGVPGGARRARVHPRPRDRRDRAARAVRRGVQRPDRADPPQHRPLRGRSGGASIPAQEPGPRLREAWDRRAWAEARPDKVVPTDGADLVARWNDELRDLGYRDPADAVPLLEATQVGLDRPRRGRGLGDLPARGEAVGVEHRRHPRQGRGPARPDQPGRRARRPDRARRGHHRPRRRPLRPAARPHPTCPSTSGP